MAKNEGLRRTHEPIVVSDTPDVCLTPVGGSDVPVPYPIVAYFSESIETTKTVRFTSDEVFTTASAIEGVLGDEAGTGLGVVSGAHAKTAYCHVVAEEHTMVVRTEGKMIVFHTSKMEMNCASPQGEGNTIGTVIWQETSNTVTTDEEGNCEGDTDPEEEPETEEELDQKLEEENPPLENDTPNKDAEDPGNFESETEYKSEGQRRSTYQDMGSSDPVQDITDNNEFQVAGAEHKWSDSAVSFGGENANIQLGGYETNFGGGYTLGADGTHALGGGFGGRFYGIQGAGQLGGPESLAQVTARAEALSFGAGADGSISAGPDGFKAEGQAGGEANLVSGSVGFLVNLTPRSIIDATANATFGQFEATRHLVPELDDDNQWLDVGVVVGGDVELGVGAAVKGEGKIENGTATGRVKLGAGPTVGLGVTGGVTGLGFVVEQARSGLTNLFEAVNFPVWP